MAERTYRQQPDKPQPTLEEIFNFGPWTGQNDGGVVEDNAEHTGALSHGSFAAEFDDFVFAEPLFEENLFATFVDYPLDADSQDWQQLDPLFRFSHDEMVTNNELHAENTPPQCYSESASGLEPASLVLSDFNVANGCEDILSTDLNSTMCPDGSESLQHPSTYFRNPQSASSYDVSPYSSSWYHRTDNDDFTSYPQMAALNGQNTDLNSVTEYDTWMGAFQQLADYDRHSATPYNAALHHSAQSFRNADAASGAELFPHTLPSAVHHSATEGCPRVATFGRTAAFADIQIGAQKRNVHTFVTDKHQEEAGRPPQKRPRIEDVPDTMCFTFVLTDPRAKTKGRDRQDEINAMRKIRACFRCKILKLQCSGKDPCDQCVRAASSATRSKRLFEARFFACLRTKPSEANPFTRVVGIAEVRSGIAFVNSVAVEVITNFEFPDSSDIMSFASFLSSDPHIRLCEPKVNLMGALLEPKTQALLSIHLPEGVLSPFNLFLTSVPLIHLRSVDEHAVGSDAQIFMSLRNWACRELLQCLDRVLVAGRLVKQPVQSLAALYLVLLGTITGIDNSYGLDRKVVKRRESVRILAHFVTFLGSRIGILTAGQQTKKLHDHAESSSHLVHKAVDPSEQPEYDQVIEIRYTPSQPFLRPPRRGPQGFEGHNSTKWKARGGAPTDAGAASVAPLGQPIAKPRLSDPAMYAMTYRREYSTTGKIREVSSRVSRLPIGTLADCL